LKEIAGEDYLATLKKLAEEKWASVRSESNLFIKLRKTQDYLIQKGYEHELVKQALQAVQKDKR
jgi:regulatory protein